jgi:hypothetical protein
MKAKKVDPRKDPLKYMETLPEKRRVCSCSKHQLFQADCQECVAEWNDFWDVRDRWIRDHKYPNHENFSTTYHGNAKEEAERRKKTESS